MHSRFVAGGVRFFGFAWILAFVLLVMAPFPVVRVPCQIALAGATAGLLLHLLVLRATDREAFSALRERLAAIAWQGRRIALAAWAAVRGAGAAARNVTRWPPSYE